MIESKTDYLAYLEADRIALGRRSGKRILTYFKNLFFPDYIWEFQKSLRKLEYYKNCKRGGLSKFVYFITLQRFQRLSLLLGFSIPPNVCGPGLSLAHRGTIVINGNAKIGANCRIHVCVNIGTEAGFKDRAPKIGNNCYIGPGAKIYGAITIADNIAIGANSVVNKDFDESHIAIAGVPAKKIADVDPARIFMPAQKAT